MPPRIRGVLRQARGELLQAPQGAYPSKAVRRALLGNRNWRLLAAAAIPLAADDQPAGRFEECANTYHAPTPPTARLPIRTTVAK
jgi:hypothetical protein